MVITMTALVVAEFLVMPFVGLCGQLNPAGDRPSPIADAGISRGCPSGSGRGQEVACSFVCPGAMELGKRESVAV